MTTSHVDLVETLKRQGNEAYAAQNYPEAVRLFTLALDADPQQHLVWSNRSAAKASMQDWQGALEDADQACRLGPETWAKGCGRKGAALMGMCRYEEAKAAFEEGLRREPANVQIKAGLQQCIEAAASSTAAKPANRQNPFADPGLLGKLAANPKTASFVQEADFVAKLRELQQSGDKPEVLMRHLSDKRIMACLGVAMGIDLEALEKPAHSPQGSLSEAEPAAQEPAAQGPAVQKPAAQGRGEKPPVPEKTPAELEKEAGTAAYKQRNFDAAMEHYRKAFELEPGCAVYLTNQAAVHFECQRWSECIETCLQAVDVGRENRASFDLLAKAFSRAGSAAQQAGDLDAAIKYYNKSLSEHRTPDVLAKLKECERERERAAKAANYDPSIAEREREAGNALFKEGKFADAVPHYTEAIKRDAADPRAYSNRAACYIKLAAVPEAIKDCETCIRLDPKFIKAYIRKATAELFKRDFEACRRTCSQALEVDATGTHAQEIQGLMMRSYAQAAPADGHSADEAGLSREERVQRAIDRDPELQKIVSDPAMRVVLQQMQADPKAAAEHMRNPMVAAKIRRLVAAGILQVA